MENATKALLLAGGVLVVIVLIALGIQMVNSTKPTTDQIQSTLSAQEIQTYNAQFIQYEGTQKGSKVKDLLRRVRLNNTTNTNKIQLSIETPGSAMNIHDSELDDAIEGIKITKTYQVKVDINAETGYVNYLVLIEQED